MSVTIQLQHEVKPAWALYLGLHDIIKYPSTFLASAYIYMYHEH